MGITTQEPPTTRFTTITTQSFTLSVSVCICATGISIRILVCDGKSKAGVVIELGLTLN